MNKKPNPIGEKDTRISSGTCGLSYSTVFRVVIPENTLGPPPLTHTHAQQSREMIRKEETANKVFARACPNIDFYGNKSNNLN